ncbi:MAG TPA: UDP-2,3-diacylglucosamine diphosphatase LpxI [Elusimicrobiales bacterium]|nr:UDP-2,3-diacylglucosamine diphosphatase LpxI [Elusimicrobiales bacterium]
MPEKIGLIAGAGNFPLLFAREARARGCEVFTAGLTGMTSPEAEKLSKELAYFRLGQLSAPIEFFKKHGITRVLMAGKIEHVSIFGGFLPDLRAAKLLLTLKDRRPNSIFAAIAGELAKDGIEVISSATFLESSLPKPGPLTEKKPHKDRENSIAAGWKAARTVADLDIGLTVVARGGAIVAVEGMEGTDECIRRAGDIFARLLPGGKPPKDMVVVKVARPGQDMRFDLPVVGTSTLEAMAAAGADTLAVEAGTTLVLEMERFLARAAELGIAVTAIEPLSTL